MSDRQPTTWEMLTQLHGLHAQLRADYASLEAENERLKADMPALWVRAEQAEAERNVARAEWARWEDNAGKLEVRLLETMVGLDKASSLIEELREKPHWIELHRLEKNLAEQTMMREETDLELATTQAKLALTVAEAAETKGWRWRGQTGLSANWQGMRRLP